MSALVDGAAANGDGDGWEWTAGRPLDDRPRPGVEPAPVTGAGDHSVVDAADRATEVGADRREPVHLSLCVLHQHDLRTGQDHPAVRRDAGHRGQIALRTAAG